MLMKRKNIFFISLLSILLLACSGHKKDARNNEDLQAKKQLQGVWLDDETESPLMLVKGDSIYYSDSLTRPVAFKVIADTLYTFGSDTASYRIEKRLAYTLWMHSLTGDEMKLHKSEDPNDATYFTHKAAPIHIYTSQVKRDSVILFKNDRYRAYTYINPSRKKVYCSSVSEDGFQVDNVYYDNIMHICVYKGAICLYDKDITKDMFSSLVSSDFLDSAILSEMVFRGIKNDSFWYVATLQQPESYISSMIDLYISLDGKLKMDVVDK
jgi:hypothetical protein